MRGRGTLAARATGVVVMALLATACPRPDPPETPARERGGMEVVSDGAAPVELDEAGSPPTSPDLRLVRAFELPGPPTDLVFHGPEGGYIAIGSGEILRFEMASDGDVTSRVVARGDTQARALEVHDGRLFVTEVDFPCTEITPDWGLVRCRTQNFPELAPEEAVAKVVRESTGRIVAYRIGPDGDLEEPQVVVGGIPIGNSDHALNGIAAGPDGWLYVSIGDIDGRYRYDRAAEEVPEERRPLLGTITRFRPDGSELEVFARGLRNVYHLTFDDEGALYGVDNDGPTANSWRFEEVIRFERGAHYGYPSDGSLGFRAVRTGEALWLLDGRGSSGIEWGPRAGMPRGLIVGACFSTRFVAFEGEWPRRGAESELFSHGGCATVVKATPEGRLVIGTLNPHLLLLYAFEGDE